MKLGNYEWDPESDLIAQGAFAEVFKARDLTFDFQQKNRFVALKIYKESLVIGTTTSSSNQKKYSLEKEFNQVISISHTNIITFYSLNYLSHTDIMGRKISCPVVAMEYAEEGTLKDFMKKTTPSVLMINKLIKDIILGLGYLHEEQIIHRDMKPGNVLITRNRIGKPLAKITDFGISRDIFTDKIIEQESFTEGVGTPHYMAPEQFFKKKFGLDQEISFRTDLWGMGVIVYWMVSGKLPFGSDSKDYETIREEILNKEPDYSNIPNHYHKFLKSCFEKYAKNRVSSCEELLRLLPYEINSEKTLIEKQENTIVNNNELNERQIHSHDSFDNSLPTIHISKKENKNEKQSQKAIEINSLKNSQSDISKLDQGDKKSSKQKLLVTVISVLLLLGVGYGGYTWHRNATIAKLLDNAWSYYKVGDYNNAYDLFISAANMGSGKAMHHLSIIYNYGNGVDIDYDKAMDYAEKAISKGYEMANFDLGWMFQNGTGVPKDTVKASTYFEKSKKHLAELVKKGDAEAQNLMGLIYDFGYTVEKDQKRAFNLFKQSAEQDHPAGIPNLGYSYRFGKGIEKSVKKAISWYEKGVKINSYRSYYQLANIYYYGDSISKNYNKAFELYKIAADNNFVSAQSQLGNLYYNGNGVAKDESNAFYWWKKAAEKDDLTAMGNLGFQYNNKKEYKKSKKWYLKGAKKNYNYSIHGLANLYQNNFKNIDSANYWFKKGAHNGYAKSQYSYGKNFYNSEGLSKSYDSAFYWYKKSAMQDYSTAQTNLGYMFENGLSVKKNVDSANYYYKLASKNGSIQGKNNLAWNYLTGNGLSKDYDKAYNLFLEAANSDNLNSLYGIGYMYYSGFGKTKNYYEAKKWFLKAANKGHIMSSAYLGDLYSSGKGGKENYVNAVKWYKKSSTNSWSQYKLGLFYYHGLGGLEKSKTQSKYWYEKSCKNGEKNACSKLKEL